MKPPFILWIKDENLAEVFDSADALVREVESPDVDDGNYSAFDIEGRLLELVVGRPGPRPRSKRFGWVSIEPVFLRPAEAEATHQDELRQLLVRTLEVGGQGTSTSPDAPIEELVARVGAASIRARTEPAIMVATTFVIVGIALLIIGWVLPQDQFGNEWIAFRYPSELWMRYFLWLLLRLVGTLLLTIYAVRAFWRESRALGAGLLLGLGIPLAAYLAVGAIGVVIDPVLEARAGPLLRLLGAVSLTAAGIFAARGTAPEQSDGLDRSPSTLLLAGSMLVAAAAILTWIVPAEMGVSSSTFFALQFLASAILATVAAVSLRPNRRSQLASGLLLGAGANAVLASSVEFVSTVLDPSLLAWLASASALVGGAVVFVNGLGTRPGRANLAERSRDPSGA